MTRSQKSGGFTLVELMIASGLSAILVAGILSAFTFLGKNLVRLTNSQEIESKSRRLLQTFVHDVSAASAVTTVTASNLILSVFTGSGTSTVTYAYDSAAKTITRTDPSNSRVLLSGVPSLSFNCYNKTGTSTSSVLSAKSIELVFTATLGASATGTQTSFTTVSPRVLLRNKSFPQ